MIETHKMCSERAAKTARETRRVLNDPREKGSSSKNRGGAGACGPITLHDASLGAHMDAAVHNVNGEKIRHA